MLKKEFTDENNLEHRARRITEQLALAFQAPSGSAHASCGLTCVLQIAIGWRLGQLSGTLDSGVDVPAILTRAHPEL